MVMSSQCLMGHILDSWACIWICCLASCTDLRCACSNPLVFPHHYLFSVSGQHLAFSALQFLLQKDLVHAASLSSSNSSAIQGLGSNSFMEQRWQGLANFRWKLRQCSQCSKVLVDHFVVWQPMGRSCSTLLAQPSSGQKNFSTSEVVSTSFWLWRW